LESLGYQPLAEDVMGIYPPDGSPDECGLAPSVVPAEHSDTAWLTDAALDLLDHSESPMLLHLNWLRPHPPLVPPAPYHRIVDPDAVALPRRPLPLTTQTAQHPLFAAAGNGHRQLREYLQRPCRVSEVTNADDRHLRAAYYGLCAEADHHLGRVIDRLKATGRWDRTMVIFLSDHGDALGDHWLYGRRGPFDGHFRVPCIIRDPRPGAESTRGTTVDRFTTNIDIMPTILDAIGTACPDGIGGRSLGPLFRSEGGGGGGPGTSNWRDHVRYEMDWTDHGLGRDGVADRFVSVRTDRYRYITFTDLPPLLFDTVEDPEESTNRAGDPVLASVEDELHQHTLAP
jgi:arylsulfatase A-like enzyme